MTPERIQIKLIHPQETALKPLIPTLHTWIREETVEGLLIDVADYRHVPNGPGLLLMGHEGDYGLAHENGRTALTYKHKRTWPTADLAERIQLALGRALSAEKNLQETLTTPIEEIELSFPDRLNAPNTAETFTHYAPTIATALSNAFGRPINLTHASQDGRQPFTVRTTIR